MKIDVRSLDISKELAGTPAGAVPQAIVARYVGENHIEGKQATHPADVGTWHILYDKIPKDTDQITWMQDKAGTHVAVPMYEYMLPERSAEGLMRFGAQFALLLTHLIDKKKKPLRTVLLLLSNVFDRLDGQPGYQVYVGAAIREEN